MTEQEAEAFAERLTRIWKSAPECEPSWGFGNGECGKHAFYYRNWLDIKARKSRQAKVCLEVREYKGQSKLLQGEGFLITLTFSFRPQHGVFLNPNGDLRVYPIGIQHEWEDFQTQFLPNFRRNCWLSGCSIEATAHEKAEWIQGFSREELKAWNLKM